MPFVSSIFLKFQFRFKKSFYYLSRTNGAVSMKPIRRLEGGDKYENVEFFIPASSTIDGDSQIPISDFLATVASKFTRTLFKANFNVKEYLVKLSKRRKNSFENF